MLMREILKDFLITMEDLTHVKTPVYSKTLVRIHKFITKKFGYLAILDAY